MIRNQWGGSFQPEGMPDVNVLIPENNDDRTELLKNLFDAGVSDRLGFTDGVMSLRLDLSDTPVWTNTGAAELAVTDTENNTVPVFFWIIEILEDPPRRFAWWSREDLQETARSWN